MTGGKILAATTNPGKLRELRRILGGLSIEVLAPQEAGVSLEVEETADTFEANASLKAAAFARASGLRTVADDSGLEVDALGGRPGVLSARYAGVPRDDSLNLRKLLDELAAVRDGLRTARFVCVVALAAPGIAPPLLFRGECPGRIARSPSGAGGFGYDPVFVAEGMDRTFAEIPHAQKDARSHRGAALAKLAAFLSRG